MLRRLLLWLLLALPLGAAGAIPPAPPSLVLDAAGAIDEDIESALAQRLAAIQASGRAQAALLIARDTDGLALSDYALQVAQAWQLGRAGKDDGLLIVLVPTTNSARIEVGYGLEGAIPDVKAAGWIDEVVLPAMREQHFADALHALLDRIDAALPAAAQEKPSDHLLDRHPEWKLPFVLVIFSAFALFPLFFGGWGAFASAPMFAGMWGFAAWLLWNSQAAAIGVGALMFVLPLAWSLNARRDANLPRGLDVVRDIGNLFAVALMFGLLTLFIGVGVSHVPEALWGGPLFAGTMALGLACLLFPGAAPRLMIVLRSVMHFLFVLMLTYPAVMEVVSEPVKVAFTIAGAFTAFIALSLWLESRGSKMAALWLIGLALLVLVPVAVLMLLQAALGEDFQTQLVQAAAGGGSLGGALWWAARHGFFAALRVGLGGRFGGGGGEGRG